MDSPQYVRGHEPSAPPLPPGQGWNQQSPYGGTEPPNAFHGRSSQGQYNPPPTVGQHILSVFGLIAKGILRTSHTMARVDLIRPYPKKERGEEEDEADEGGIVGVPRGAYYDQPTNEMVPSRASARRSSLYGFKAVQGKGARLKLMQIWDFPSEETGEPSLPWGLSIGVGANYDVDRSHVEPKLRIRTDHLALHILPKPEAEIRAKYPLGIAALMLDLRFRLPLDFQSENVWGGVGGARLLVNLTHPVGTGIHLAPGGLEFDERVWRIGRYTDLRVAASMKFPRRIPLEEQPVKIRIHRLGIRTRLA